LRKDLFTAIKEDNRPEVRRLIEDEKVDIESEIDIDEGNYNEERYSPLRYCIIYGELDLVKYLLDQGANINGGLILAVTQDLVEITRELLIRGADISEQDGHGYTFLEIIFDRHRFNHNRNMVNMILDTAVFEQTIIKPAKK